MVLDREHSAKLEAVGHFDATSINEVTALLKEFKGEAKIIAGGTDLVGLMKNRGVTPKALVNIKSIRDLGYIKEDAKGIKIGTLTTIADLLKSEIVKEKYSVLLQVAQLVASPQIRNMATIGGNLCQEVRCWYFRRSPATGATYLCRRKGGKRCYAVGGKTYYHAIIPAHECHAVCPSDLASALLALEARVKIISPFSERVVPLEKFYSEMGNILQSDEMLTEIQIPPVETNVKQRYIKFSLRKAVDFAISSVAVVMTMEAGKVAKAKIVLGGVSSKPYRTSKAEKIIEGQPLTENVIIEAAEAALEGAVPFKDNAFKIRLTKSLLKRALLGTC